MAELGTFAAAVQIAETVLKFRKLWSDIRQAPEDLDELVDTVIQHADLLGNLRRQPSIPAGGADDECWKKCCKIFEKCVASLQALVDELTSIRQLHSKTASLRLYLRKDQVNKCKERLQRPQMIVIQAQQAYANATYTHYNALMLEEVRRLTQLVQSQSPQNVQRRTKKRRSKARNASDTVDAGSSLETSCNIPKRSGRQVMRSRSNIDPSFSLQFPTWTAWRCVQLWFHRSNQLFGFTFKVYNTRSNDSDLFRASRRGDWAHVSQMFSTGAASPFDVDEWQTTLLHIAAGQARAEICQFLISEGLDVSCRTWPDNKTPLETLASTFRSMHEKEPTSKALLKTTRLLLASDPGETVDYSNEPKHWLHRCSLPASVLSVLTSALVPSYESVKPELRARFVMSTTASDPKAITTLLGHNLNLYQAIRLTSATASGAYGCRQLILNASRCLARDKLSHERRRGWLDVISSIVRYEKQNTIRTMFSSFYMHYIAYYGAARRLTRSILGHKTWNEALTSIGRLWLEILVSCGANLEHYAKAEDAPLDHDRKAKEGEPECRETIIWRDARGRSHCWRLKFLLFGPKIDDWKVFVVPSAYTYRQNVGPRTRRTYTEGHNEFEMVGEFWEMIENPEAFGVPGTFIDDHEQVKLSVGKPVKVKGPIF